MQTLNQGNNEQIRRVLIETADACVRVTPPPHPLPREGSDQHIAPINLNGETTHAPAVC